MSPPSQSREWDVVLRDGSTLHIRPYVPADAAAVRAFLHGLSPETIFLRFFGMASPESFDMSGLDSSQPANRYTMLADVRGRVLALATYVRSETRRDEAEAAFVIADRLQGRGLGTRLLELLAGVARAEDIGVFTAHVLGQNARMREVFRESGFPIEVTPEDGGFRVALDLKTAAHYEERAFGRSRQAAAASMKGLFQPTSVAVVGVGRSGTGIGAEIFHNLRSGFTGRVVPINPRASSIDGSPATASVRDIPGDVDLAVIAVPAAQVLTVVDDCVAKGVRGLVVITAGFAETGAEGRRLQTQLVERVRDAGIRMVGPNCMGILNTDPAVRLNATFSPVYPPAGTVAMSTQSGALGLAILDYARHLNIGISSFASIGNKADVSSNDLIQYWADDPRTTVILLYLESFGNPRTFARLARHVGRTKPIVTIKAGRSTAGARAAGSHTGALASSDVVVEGLFRQAGIIRVTTLEEMFDAAVLLAHQPVPKGPRLGILTNAGGAGILAADAAESHGLEVPTLSAATVSQLRRFLPASAAAANPVDMLASAGADEYRQALMLMAEDPGIDSILAIYVPPLVTDPSAVASAIVSGAALARNKPVVATFMSAAGAPAALSPIPCYRFPEAAALALARAATYGRWRERPRAVPDTPRGVDKGGVRTILEGARQRGGGWLTITEAQQVLDRCGIPVAAAVLVTSEADVVQAAESMGFPVAVKAVGPEILHKTDVGGVQLDLRDSATVGQASRSLQARLGDRLTGFLVQRMVPAGVEMLVGTVEDDVFGPVVLCSLGGTQVELLGKPVARLVPLSDADVDELLRDMPGRALLSGYRGSPPVDERALRGLLCRVSWLADTFPEIVEMDLNPVRLFERGLSVVDVRMRVGEPSIAHNARRIAY